MKLIREDNDKVNVINFLFVGMLEETAERYESFIIAVYAEIENRPDIDMAKTMLPVVSRAIREFLHASRWLVRSVEEVILVPHELPHPKPCDFLVFKTGKFQSWDDVEAALMEYTRKHTEGFKITCERSPKCEEFITEDSEKSQ